MAQLDEQRIRAMIKEEIRTSNSSLRFQQTAIPKHIHNGVDSPFVFNPSQIYAGSIIVDINAQILAGIPVGWGIENPSVGQYKIIHNLGTTAYLVVATPWSQVPTSFVAALVYDSNASQYFTVSISDYQTATLRPGSFQFFLLNVDNRTLTPPRYLLPQDG